MKNLIILLIVVLGILPNGNAQFNFSVVDNCNNENKNECAKLNAENINSNIHLDIEITNGKGVGYYSLVKTSETGKMQSIGTMPIQYNKKNEPKLYCFVDTAPSNDMSTYSLYKIAIGEGKTQKSDIIQSWTSSDFKKKEASEIALLQN